MVPWDPSWQLVERTPVATYESEQRMARRRHQRWLEGWRASPENQARRRERLVEARKRRRRKVYLFPPFETA